MGAAESDRSWSCTMRHYISRDRRRLSLTLSSLCGRLLLGMKRGFTTGTWRAKSSRCSGDMLHPLLQGSSELHCLLGNSMATIFGTVKDYCWLTTCLPRVQWLSAVEAAWRHQGETQRNADPRSLAVARQRSSPQVHDCTGGCSRLWLRTVRPSCIHWLHSRPDTQWLFPVPQSGAVCKTLS